MFRQVYNALIGNGNVIVKDATSIFFNCKNQADKRIWYTKGLVTDDFRSRHTLLLLHIWIINSRLVNKEGKRGLQTQECLFDEFWDETSKRIRAVGINELSVNKRLLEVQKYSWQVCTELDSTMATTKQTDVEKLDNIGSILWRHLYNENDSIEDTHVLILAK